MFSSGFVSVLRKLEFGKVAGSTAPAAGWAAPAASLSAPVPVACFTALAVLLSVLAACQLKPGAGFVGILVIPGAEVWLSEMRDSFVGTLFVWLIVSVGCSTLVMGVDG